MLFRNAMASTEQNIVPQLCLNDVNIILQTEDTVLADPHNWPLDQVPKDNGAMSADL